MKTSVLLLIVVVLLILGAAWYIWSEQGKDKSNEYNTPSLPGVQESPIPDY